MISVREGGRDTLVVQREGSLKKSRVLSFLFLFQYICNASCDYRSALFGPVSY